MDVSFLLKLLICIFLIYNDIAIKERFVRKIIFIFFVYSNIIVTFAKVYMLSGFYIMEDRVYKKTIVYYVYLEHIFDLSEQMM